MSELRSGLAQHAIGEAASDFPYTNVGAALDHHTRKTLSGIEHVAGRKNPKGLQRIDPQSLLALTFTNRRWNVLVCVLTIIFL